MKYLKISNRGTLNRKYLELIGFTTKRERAGDPSVIGTFGSGTKFSAVAALRLGLRVAITSTDYLGRYVLRFEPKEIDVSGRKVQQIHLRYSLVGSDGKVYESCHPWCMTIDAFKDWDEPIGSDDKRGFKCLREFICNAKDEDPDFRLELAERLTFASPGETSVFIAYEGDVRKILDESPKYFKFLSGDLCPSYTLPLRSVPGIGDIYPRSDNSRTRIFVLGVMIDCSDDVCRSSVHDYSLYDKALVSEERIVKNQVKLMSEIGKLLACVDDADTATALLAAAHAGLANLERSALGQIRSLGAPQLAVWLEAVTRVFGDGICIATQNTQVDNDAEQIYGYKIVAVHYELRYFLQILGIPLSSEVVPEKPEHEFVRYSELDIESQVRFIRAYRVFAEHFPERAGVPIAFYLPSGEDAKKFAGFAFENREVWIAVKTATTLGSVRKLFETLVHESRHIATGAGDYDRAFVNAADTEVSVLAFRASCEKRFDKTEEVPKKGKSRRPNLVVPKVEKAK